MKFNAAILFAAAQAAGVLSSAVGLDSSSPGNVQKRECWHGKSYGCSESGFCWKKCGGDHTGAWCWTARNDGFGDWYTCSNDNDCNTDMPCSQAVDGCDDCGCSC
ncbi:hypothetical protein DL766_004238 [Monosporascus sp. MC13-8B]|uniref:IDI-2 n=1 Tax=Monosporascus cannonballus TaxID=155416 RepID=A0ABY0GSH4_9PEZI|nr:hypothetical protein DL762_009936 [Monosporascus cannonballus]RYO76491.1 hypothetical protein DL763_010432 [Monosporascus cannonballus]RYP31789.1 hypothetical protein DL766_004238 [Monosporascus sp. MC13-8B]